MFGCIIAVGLFTWNQLTWLASSFCNLYATFWRVYRFDISFGRTYVSSRNFSTMIWNYELPRNSHLQMQLSLYTILKVEPPMYRNPQGGIPPIVLGHGPCDALGQILAYLQLMLRLSTLNFCKIYMATRPAGRLFVACLFKRSLEFRTRGLLWRKWTYAILQVWPRVCMYGITVYYQKKTCHIGKYTYHRWILSLVPFCVQTFGMTSVVVVAWHTVVPPIAGHIFGCFYRRRSWRRGPIPFFKGEKASWTGLSHTIHVWYMYLHLVDFYGKCREIYHTWIVWVWF